MPELPEVQTVVETLRPHIVGRRIRRAELMRGDILTPTGCDLCARLDRRTIRSIERRAKRIVFGLGDDNRFYIHLGMTGRLTIDPPDAPRRLHTHFVLFFEAFEVRFSDPRRFGGIWWLGTEADDDRLGPEPLTMRSSQLARALGKTARVIKTALLDQSVVAGLGNIYVDEALFEAGIHPLIPSNELGGEEIETLTRAIKRILRRAIRHRGSTLRDYMDANGDAGAFQKLHRVYDRAGQPCARCKRPLVRIVVAGRSTHFCPACQPAPAIIEQC